MIYLLNGIRLQGRVVGFDQYVVSIRDRNVQMVYKRNISTIVAAAEPEDRAGNIVAATAMPPPQGQERNGLSRKTITVRSRRKLLAPGS